MKNGKIKIYVQLLEEGSDTILGTTADDLGNGTYRLLPTPEYDPEDQIWEFLPGSVVRIKEHKLLTGEKIWYAFEEVK